MSIFLPGSAITGHAVLLYRAMSAQRACWTQRLVSRMAAQPALFDALRWILEAGFKGEKGVLRREKLAECARILDLGCGTGALAGEFPAKTYWGIDPNPQYIRRAKKLRPEHRFLVMDGRRLAFGKQSFDAVLISGVIHHLKDEAAQKTLSEAARVLKPAGRLVMWEDVPARSKWNVIGRMIHRLDEGEHIRTGEHYAAMLRSFFRKVDSSLMSSGFCDYVVLVTQKQAD